MGKLSKAKSDVKCARCGKSMDLIIAHRDPLTDKVVKREYRCVCNWGTTIHVPKPPHKRDKKKHKGSKV